MRISRTISISIAPPQLKEIANLAKKEHRTLSELVREALRRYQEEDKRRESLANLRAVVETARVEAARSGSNRLTAPEIAAEIAAVRKTKGASRTRSVR